MTLIHRSMVSVSLLLAMVSNGTAMAAASKTASPKADAKAAQLWTDYNHYVLIARPSLAAASAKALLDRVDAEQLLVVVESSPYRDAYLKTFAEAEGNETLKTVTRKLSDRVQAARIAKSRDTQRIKRDIGLLAGTLRQNRNATERLRAAGQFAAPRLLRVLLDEKQQALHPYVETAMEAIGRPLVYPLCVAITELEPVQIGQVARVLANIGYPRAIPYLKEILETQTIDSHARRTVSTAYEQLAGSVGTPADVSAAELYLTLAHNYYEAGTQDTLLPGFDSAANRGIVWTYSPAATLVHFTVPASIYADVLSMRTARRALALDRQLDPALSLWLAANLRRENRLPEGESDESYGLQRPPMYYARMAGPLRMHDVLARAMRDGDADLGMDAIAVLRAIAGTDALINRKGAMQPLLHALGYADRRIRFPAAFVMTQTRPTESFPDSEHVVTVLAEAVRQSPMRHALAIAADQDVLNGLIANLKDLGYQVNGARSLDALIDVVNRAPGIDVIVAELSANQITNLVHETRQNYKLSAAPILGLVSASDQAQLNLQLKHEPRLRTALATNDAEQLRQAIKDTLSAFAGRPINAEEAAGYASTALKLLRQISQSQSPVYDASDAEPALIAAIDDKRPKIVKQAGRVLELIDSQGAQLAIAEAALDTSRSGDVRINLLNSLAESAKHYGNKLGEIQLDNLLEVVRTADGEMALAASRAHGALTLPTANLVELVTQ